MPTRRDVNRQWSKRGCHVSTFHPGCGELRRGTIRAVPGGWTAVDPDGYVLDIVGDYLDAETALLEATSALDT